jgi:hypothetical protein
MNDIPKAWSVKRLAAAWDCSPRHIYDLIDAGQLKAFAIGEKSLRITDEEKRRCESKPAKSIDEGTPSSDGAERLQSQIIAMKAVSAAVRG